MVIGMAESHHKRNRDMTLNITDAELHEWAKLRADDAGRLARELVACRLQSQAAVAAAYEAAAEICFAPEAAHIAWDMGQGNFPKRSARHEFIAAMIRALATQPEADAFAAALATARADGMREAIDIARVEAAGLRVKAEAPEFYTQKVRWMAGAIQSDNIADYIEAAIAKGATT